MISAGSMKSLMVVGVYNTGDSRCDEYTYSYDASEDCGGLGDE